MKKISEIANKLNVEIDNYGNYIAKITSINSNKNGKLILVTSTNPTPYGEGKTTLSIGLCDSLNKLNKNAIAVLREPSMGPVFGKKGGAVGGGKSVIVPEEKINLHFTGDMHAITSANNLLCAIIYNHIYQGNSLNIDKVVFKRCLDVNDRSLRDSFVITPASEIMAIFCLSKDLNDLKERLGNIIVGYTKEGNEIYSKDLNCVNALFNLLKDAFNVNLVQTLYSNPVIVHGGPFANIAHGCSSINSIKTALKISDYVVTEAGFGSDMGAIKFFDIVCKNNDIYPDAVIINTTAKALKYNGDNSLEKGISNLEYHINNMKKYSSNVIVSINRFNDDTDEEIKLIKDFSNNLGIKAYESTNYIDGEDGCISLANEIINLNGNSNHYKVYEKEDKLIDKINKMAKEFGAVNVFFSEKAKLMLNKYNDSKLDICVSKTPMSLTDDSKVLGYPKNFTITVTDINVFNGAGFITIYLGNVITMPGLSADSNYLKM